MKKKCDTSKCHAACCYNVPMEKGYLSAYRKHIVNPVIRIEWQKDEEWAKAKFGRSSRENYLVYTDEDLTRNRCPFLRADCRCNIYENRPIICRRFGLGKDRFLNCHYLTGIETKVTREEIVNILTK